MRVGQGNGVLVGGGGVQLGVADQVGDGMGVLVRVAVGVIVGDGVAVLVCVAVGDGVQAVGDGVAVLVCAIAAGIALIIIRAAAVNAARILIAV